MQYKLIHSKLAHLNEDEIEFVVREYYRNVKIDTLIERFNIDCTRGQFFTLLPPEPSDQVCPNCGSTMAKPLRSKNKVQFKIKCKLFCPQCSHREQYLCTCPSCRKNRKAETNFSYNRHPLAITPTLGKVVDVNDLSFIQAISLLSFLEYRGQSSTNASLIKQVRNQNLPFSPTGEYCGQLLQSLVNGGMLGYSTSGVQKSHFAISNVYVNAQASNYIFTELVTPKLIENIKMRLSNRDWPEYWRDAVSEVAFDLAFAEVREFYEFCATERGFPLRNGGELNVLIEFLQHFSVGQCFHIIFRGAQSAADFMVRNDVSSHHAASYMLKVCKNYADRARSSNKNLSPFSRNWNCPRSIFSSILYDDVLKIYGDGISTRLSEVAGPAD